MKEQKEKRKNNIIIIFALLLIAAAFLVGMILFNRPANRLSRQLDLGEKYLEEQNYAQAVVEFDKAIAIDPMNERAYIGKAKAYVGMGDYEQVAATYGTALQAVPGAGGVWSAAEQFYLDYAQIYIDDGDFEQAVVILEEGYDLLGSEKIYLKIEEITQSAQQQAEEEQRASGIIAFPFRLQDITVRGYDLMDDHFAEMRGLYPTGEGYERTDGTEPIFQEPAADGSSSYFINTRTYDDSRYACELYVDSSAWDYKVGYYEGRRMESSLTLNGYYEPLPDYEGLNVPVRPGNSYEDWCSVMQIAQIQEKGLLLEQENNMFSVPEDGEYPSRSFGAGENSESWVFRTDEYRGVYQETKMDDYGTRCDLTFEPPMTYTGERRASHSIDVQCDENGVIRTVTYRCY
ncbi:MAG: tetratricopeptide repeat protein [Eubacterium sp.]|nr:tetratricopeptide repeat protein [Eubacterium sp.]